MNKLLKSLFSLFLFFSLTACNEAKNLSAELTAQTANPLSDFLASSSKPAVIKFHAEWCSTCKSYQSNFEAAREELKDQVDFFEVNVDDSQYKELVKYAKISRIPDTFFVSADRKNVSRKLGNIHKTKLIPLIQELLLN